MPIEKSFVDMDEEEDEKNEIARSSHAGMLHDYERHKKYFDALKETIKDLKLDGQENIHVLDIGTGTGILSMMAANAGGDNIVACEMFEPVGKLAREIIKINNLSSKVTVVTKASTEMKIPADMPVRADILVTEIFDSELLGEGVLPTLRDAHKRLTKQNVRTIPSAASVNIQLIQSQQLWQMNKLEEDLVGLKLPDTYAECPGTASTHELQISQFYSKHLQILSKAKSITTFDFTQPYIHSSQKLESKSNSAKQSVHETDVYISDNGTIHAVLLWWDLILHKEKNIVLSMEPSWLRKKGNDYIWRDHWMQCVYYLQKPLNVKTGDQMIVQMFHDDYSIWFDVSLKKVEQNVNKPPPLCSCSLHVAWPPERFALWNDSNYISIWSSFICAKEKESILVIGGISLLPLILHKNNNVDVCYMEYSEMSSEIIKNIAKFNNINISYLAKQEKEQLSLLGTSLCYDAIVFDPIWSSSILPWHNLKIWSILSNLKSSPYIQYLKCYPQKAYLKACVVDFVNLWKVQSPVVSSEEFDLKKFDAFIDDARSPKDILGHGKYYYAAPYAIIEYEHDIISNIVTLSTFDFTETSPKESCFGKTDFHCCNIINERSGIVSWVDFQVDNNIVISTGLDCNKDWVRYSRQGIVFVPNEVVSKGSDILTCDIMYEPCENEVLFSFC